MAGRKANGEGTISTVMARITIKLTLLLVGIVMVNRLEKVLVAIKSLWFWIK